jgi:hypothetical protein
MSWSKTKQNLEHFLSPSLHGKFEYGSTSYRYLSDKAGQCYITVDKKNILNMSDSANLIRWYRSELEIKNDPDLIVPIHAEDIEAVRNEIKGPVPEDRLLVIAIGRKKSELAKKLITAQSELSKSNFIAVATAFLSTPINQSMESEHILLNVLALVDRRIGKKRITNMSDIMKLKHPIVQYFYELRLRTLR